MKTNHFFYRITALTLVMLLYVGVEVKSFAQTPESIVLAISKDGFEHQIHTSLKVVVFPHLDPLKFKVGLENAADEYVVITLKDFMGNLIYNYAGIRSKKCTINFDMAMLGQGIYTLSISNKLEKYRYKITLQSMVTRSLELSSYASAKGKK